ncbi:MAG: tetratricopeptide repeat protein [Isosphaeraceae bacterium]
MATPRPVVWTLPDRPDPGFVGREEELAALAAALTPSGRSAQVQPVALHGLGGVGKTHLAVEFAVRREADYDAVLWLPAEEPTALASAFAALAADLGLPEGADADQPARVSAVIRWLDSHTRWLLIFDNAERREEVEPYLPRRVRGQVVITSRNPDWGKLARPVKVGPMSRADAVRLLCGGPADVDPGGADALAKALGDLPLALAQAASYVHATGCSFAEYQSRFESYEAALDSDEWAEPGYGRTVAATLALALRALRPPGAKGPTHAETLLKRCAFYAPDRIPRELLAAHLPETSELDDAVRTLRRYSLVETEPGFVSVHRLVQRAVRSRMGKDERRESSQQAVQAVVDRFPDRPFPVPVRLQGDRLISHALQAVQWGEENGLNPVLLSILLQRLAGYLWAKVDLRAARPLGERVVAMREAALGADHPSVAEALNNLGLIARDQRDLSGARRFHERALEIYASGHFVDKPDVARSMMLLSNVLADQRDLESARLYQGQALKIQSDFHDPESVEVALVLANLGMLSQETGDLAKSRSYLERALAVFENEQGPDDPFVARTLTNLSVIAYKQNDLSNSEQYARRARAICESVQGTTHPDYARALGSLGVLAQDRGDWSEARSCHERTLEILEALYGPDDVRVAGALGNLGIVLGEMGEIDQARRLFLRALPIFRASNGEDHTDTIRTVEQLRKLDERSRAVPLPQKGGPVVKVLFLAAGPSDDERLALDEECRAIDAKIRSSEHRDRLKLVSHWAVRLDDLSGFLMREKPDVVHFSGHGEETGELNLLAADGTSKPVPPEGLERLFRAIREDVKVVVFNACFSSAQAQAVAKTVDVAVGMGDELDDEHAIAFAAEFYQGLGYGKSVAQAFDLGLSRLISEGFARAEEVVRLYKKRGVDPDALVLVRANP